jgi:enoyl-CoA hydratase/carnithine racemase
VAERGSKSTGTLAIEQRGPVLVVGLDRTHKRNAINDETIAALDECFSTVPPEVSAAIIHGVGPHFSAGLDLSEISARWAKTPIEVDRASAGARPRGRNSLRNERRGIFFLESQISASVLS